MDVTRPPERSSSGDRDRIPSNASSTNGQLPTPSLSPIGSPVLRPPVPNGDYRVRRTSAAADWGADKTVLEEDMLHLDTDGDAAVLPQVARRPSHDSSSRRRTNSRLTSPVGVGEVLKLSPAKIHELTSSPESLPIRAATPITDETLTAEKINGSLEDKENILTNGHVEERGRNADSHHIANGFSFPSKPPGLREGAKEPQTATGMGTMPSDPKLPRPDVPVRTHSTPPNVRRRSASKTHSALQQAVNHAKLEKPIPPPLNLKATKTTTTNGSVSNSAKPPSAVSLASPLPSSIPLPPMSIPTYLELELSSERPSPLYIYRSNAVDYPYESFEIKFERLMNFVLLFPALERVLAFGAMACVDSFLYTFTILPLRFSKAISLLIEWMVQNFLREARDIGGFIYKGFPRFWTRRSGQRRRSSIPKKELEKLQTLQTLHATSIEPTSSRPRQQSPVDSDPTDTQRKRSSTTGRKHRRARSTVSALGPSHKADLLKGLLIVISCAVLLRFDASRMYHGVRGQATIKLYVIYNVLEVSLFDFVRDCLLTPSRYWTASYPPSDKTFSNVSSPTRCLNATATAAARSWHPSSCSS